MPSGCRATLRPMRHNVAVKLRVRRAPRPAEAVAFAHVLAAHGELDDIDVRLDGHLLHVECNVEVGDFSAADELVRPIIASALEIYRLDDHAVEAYVVTSVVKWRGGRWRGPEFHDG